MAEAKLTPFSYVILVLVGKGGAGPHDLVRMMREGLVYWSASESHYYAEPKRLEGMGLLRSERRPGRTTSRTHYTLTAAGRRALAEWMATPASFPRIQSEVIVRVLGADLVDEALVAASLSGLREDIARLSAGLAEAEAAAPALPHRERYLRLVHGLGRDLLRVHADWADRVERELGAP